MNKTITTLAMMVIVLVIPAHAVIDVVITEVHYDPVSPEVDNEFIELFVLDDYGTQLDLFGWVITTFDSDDETLPSISDVSIGDFIVIIPGNGTSDLDASDGVATVYLDRTTAMLGNTGDEVGLFDEGNTLIDFMRYEGGNGDSVLGNWPSNDDGPQQTNSAESVQLQGPDQDNGNNWASSTPTKGAANFPDQDRDLVPTQEDNCPETYNPDQADSDQDGRGDVCDSRDDRAQSGPGPAGVGIGLDITPEEFAPLIWMCDSRMVLEDAVEEGRKTIDGDELKERTQNYAFEGEQIQWTVLVMDKNKIEQVQDVVATVGSVQGTGNDVEVECGRRDNIQDGARIPDFCEARILEEELEYFDADTMAVYDCTLTVETQDSMVGEHFITVEVVSEDGEATMDENEYWFLNPNIGLTIDGSLLFEDVRPGSVSYSDTLVVTNDADVGSGVLLDMFISGTDFYDPDSSGAKCPTSNRLKLSNGVRSQAQLGHGETSNGPHVGLECQAGNVGLTADNADHLCYFATNGNYDTFNDGDGSEDNADPEGYRPIVYSDQFLPDFYNDAEIIANNDLVINGIVYDAGNVLAPGADIAVTFKLGLPEPCVGDFSDGQIYFWGEAI